MAVKISLPDGVKMRIDGRIRMDVEIGSNGVRIVIADAEIEEMSIVIGSRDRNKARLRRAAGKSEVTPEMEAAAIESFLAGADVARLGRSLAGVYRAMDAVRSRRQEFDDDDD